MNDDAVLYAKFNVYQRNVIKKILKQYTPSLQWRRDGGDSVLDIGCGSGDVTKEIILPALPSSFERLIGCDLSGEMLKYARQHHHHPKVSFEKVDIREPIDEFLTKYGSFDHILSFFCLNWVRQQKEAFENIKKLLKPSGDCLLMFIVSTNAYTVYNDMSKTQKWSQYMKDVDVIIPAQHYISDSASIVGDFRLCIESIGLTCSTIETREVSHVYENYEQLKDFFRSVNPFIKRIPCSDQEDFLNELLQRLMKMYKEQKCETEYFVSAKIVIIVARK